MPTDVSDQLALLCAVLDDALEPVAADEAIRRASSSLRRQAARTPVAASGRHGASTNPPARWVSRREVRLDVAGDRGRWRWRTLWSVVAVAVLAASVLGLWFVATWPDGTRLESADTAPTTATPLVRAQDELARLVASAVTDLGWSVQLPDDVASSSSRTSGTGASYAEVRLALPEHGDLLVSISTGDLAAAAGTVDRELLRSSGTASVYLGTDSDSARAVELIDGSTIVYVRSESNVRAERLDDLTTLALAVNDSWAPGTIAYDTGGAGEPPTVFAPAPPATVGATAPVSVHHTSVRVTLAADLTCAATTDHTGRFTSFVVDTYADLAGQRWLTRTTYPDGTTWDRITLGSPIYATAAATRGDPRNAELGCIGPDGDPSVLTLDPTAGTFYALTLTEDLLAADLPYLQTFTELGAVVPGDDRDDEGRPAERWEQRIDGFASYGNAAPDMPVRQTQTWWVDPDDHTTVTQHRMVNQIDGMGTATVTEVLVTDEQVDVDTALFDTTGMVPAETFPRPDLVEPPATAPASSSIATSTS